MRFGIVVYQESANLGDDIQSFAAKQFLPQVDYYIEREALDSFCSEYGESVAVIMNGWYLYEHYNWPPSPYIVPKLISMHFDTFYSWKCSRRLTENYVLSNYGAQYLKQYGPVGCRDEGTLAMLQNRGLDSYYSGCLTSCLQPYNDIPKSDYICLVDVPEILAEQIKAATRRPVRLMSHYIELKGLTIEERFSKVEEYLKIYQGAHCVITSRLHCALPCLALGTPVLFAYADWMQNRVESFLPYFHVCSQEPGHWAQVYNIEQPPLNPQRYQQDREKLYTQCRSFISDLIEIEDSPIPQAQIEMAYRQRLMSLKEIVQVEAEKGNQAELKQLRIDELESTLHRIDELESTLQKIYHSRFWKIANLYYKLCGYLKRTRKE